MWSARPLTLKGKVTVINSIFISQVLYPCSVLYIPQPFIDELHTLFINFMWNNKRPKIKHSCMIADIENGGLRFPDIGEKIKAIKLAWIQRLFDSSVQPWKACLEHQLKKDVHILIHAAPKTKDLPNSMNSFYIQVFSFWHDYFSQESLQSVDIIRQPLWLNSNILVAGKPVYYKRWIDKGIIFISDVCNNEGKILSRETICDKFDININFLEYLSLCSAIPEKWKYCIKNYNNDDVLNIMDYPIVKVNSVKKSLVKVKCKDFYWSLINKIVSEPTSKNKWVQKYDLSFDNVTWKYFYNLPKMITIDTYLQSFQFKILHRIFPCGQYLYTVKIREHDLCIRCNDNLTDTIEHYFYTCSTLKGLWQSIFDLIFNIFHVRIKLSLYDIIFGIKNLAGDCILNVINFIILVAKSFIYNCERNDNNIDFILYCKDLKFKVDTLKVIMYRNNKMTEFDDTWNILLNYL